MVRECMRSTCEDVDVVHSVVAATVAASNTEWVSYVWWATAARENSYASAKCLFTDTRMWVAVGLNWAAV